MGCGHGLVGLLIAYRFPDMQVVLYDLQKRRGFDVLVEAFELHGHHGKGQTKVSCLSRKGLVYIVSLYCWHLM